MVVFPPFVFLLLLILIRVPCFLLWCLSQSDVSSSLLYCFNVSSFPLFVVYSCGFFSCSLGLCLLLSLLWFDLLFSDESLWLYLLFSVCSLVLLLDCLQLLLGPSSSLRSLLSVLVGVWLCLGQLVSLGGVLGDRSTGPIWWRQWHLEPKWQFPSL